VFSGRTWTNQIYPMVKNVILQSDWASTRLGLDALRGGNAASSQATGCSIRARRAA
jgi:hypothetical protein